MPHSLVQVWLHIIWGTKFRKPFIDYKIEKQVYKMLEDEFNAKGCKVSIINGMPDHIHCLIRLGSSCSIADVVKAAKGQVAYSINEIDLVNDKFAWQTGYAAFSVSQSNIPKVYNYIKNQKTHHLKQSFEEEYNYYLSLNNE
jgi:putative transposase